MSKFTIEGIFPKKLADVLFKMSIFLRPLEIIDYASRCGRFGGADQQGSFMFGELVVVLCGTLPCGFIYKVELSPFL